MNPSGQPFPNNAGAPPPSGSGGGAQEALNVPSILLIVFGAIGVLFSLYGIVGGGANAAQLDQALANPNVPEGAKNFLKFLVGPGSKLLNLLSAALAGVIVFGGVQMRGLKMYPLAMAACIVGMLPCTNCCCVTLPIGIWALTVLMKPEVKAAFS